MTNKHLYKKRSLLRAQFGMIVLLGAFAYFYFSTLQGERIAAFLRQQAATPESLEQILRIAPWHIGIAATGFVVFAAALCLKFFTFRPLKWHLWQKLLLLFLAILSFCALTSPKEEQTIEQRMERLNLCGEYAAALKAGATRENPSAKILELRVVALEHSGTLNDDFFKYPLGKIPESFLTAMADTAQTASPRNILCHLLSRNLVQLAAICKTIPADSLQQAEAEALVLYTHTRIHSVFTYSNAAIEANYNDFQSLRQQLRKRYASRQAYSMPEANLMREAYGQTYWYYYYYGQR